MSTIKALDLGQLPAEAINRTLDMELNAGSVKISAAAQVHAKNRHANDFARCFPYLGEIIANPLYVRDDFRNDGKIELVGNPIGLEEWLLVAVTISLDADGCYNVVSFYPISAGKIAKRRESGHLRRLI